MAPQVPSLGASISLDGPKVYTRVAAKVPSLGASISLDGSVHNRVAPQVPSLGATISLDGPKVHTRVAPQVPSLGATVSLDGLVQNQAATRAVPPAHMEPPTHKPTYRWKHLAEKPHRHHQGHQNKSRPDNQADQSSPLNSPRKQLRRTSSYSCRSMEVA